MCRSAFYGEAVVQEFFGKGKSFILGLCGPREGI